MMHTKNNNNITGHAPEEMVQTDIAIIGAGIAGLACARRLNELPNVRVTVFEADADIGGRAKSWQEAGGRFDAGAQFLTTSHEYFEHEVKRWRDSGVVQPWLSRFWRHSDNETRLQVHDLINDRWIGYGGMSAVADVMAQNVDIRTGLRLTALEQMQNAGGTSRWSLSLLREDGAAEIANADIVLLAIPAPQAVPFLAAAPDLQQAASQASFAPCWSVMVSWDAPVDVVFEAISGETRSRVRASLPHVAGSDHPVAWLCRENAKPGRTSSTERWVIHATVDFSLAHQETAPDAVARILFDAARDMTNPDLSDPDWIKAVLFETARVVKPAGQDCLYDAGAGLGAAGDWCIGASIERAWLSGHALAQSVMTDMQDRAARQEASTAQEANRLQWYPRNKG